jgi:acyl-coenzyme A thioesterase PaaI-like protein
MKLLEELRDAGQGRDLGELLRRIPYASFLGLQVEMQGDEVITVLPFAEHLVGNPNLPALHGGMIGAMLEMTSVLQLLYDASCARLPKTIDVSFDFLRFARCTTTYGRANRHPPRASGRQCAQRTLAGESRHADCPQPRTLPAVAAGRRCRTH